MAQRSMPFVNNLAEHAAIIKANHSQKLMHIPKPSSRSDESSVRTGPAPVDKDWTIDEIIAKGKQLDAWHRQHGAVITNDAAIYSSISLEDHVGGQSARDPVQRGALVAPAGSAAVSSSAQQSSTQFLGSGSSSAVGPSSQLSGSSSAASRPRSALAQTAAEVAAGVFSKTGPAGAPAPTGAVIGSSSNSTSLMPPPPPRNPFATASALAGSAAAASRQQLPPEIIGSAAGSSAAVAAQRPAAPQRALTDGRNSAVAAGPATSSATTTGAVAGKSKPSTGSNTVGSASGIVASAPGSGTATSSLSSSSTAVFSSMDSHAASQFVDARLFFPTQQHQQQQQAAAQPARMAPQGTVSVTAAAGHGTAMTSGITGSPSASPPVNASIEDVAKQLVMIFSKKWPSALQKLQRERADPACNPRVLQVLESQLQKCAADAAAGVAAILSAYPSAASVAASSSTGGTVEAALSLASSKAEILLGSLGKLRQEQADLEDDGDVDFHQELIDEYSALCSGAAADIVAAARAVVPAARVSAALASGVGLAPGSASIVASASSAALLSGKAGALATTPVAVDSRLGINAQQQQPLISPDAAAFGVIAERGGKPNNNANRRVSAVTVPDSAEFDRTPGSFANAGSGVARNLIGSGGNGRGGAAGGVISPGVVGMNVNGAMTMSSSSSSAAAGSSRHANAAGADFDDGAFDAESFLMDASILLGGEGGNINQHTGGAGAMSSAHPLGHVVRQTLPRQQFPQHQHPSAAASSASASALAPPRSGHGSNYNTNFGANPYAGSGVASNGIMPAGGHDMMPFTQSSQIEDFPPSATQMHPRGAGAGAGADDNFDDGDGDSAEANPAANAIRYIDEDPEDKIDPGIAMRASSDPSHRLLWEAAVELNVSKFGHAEGFRGVQGRTIAAALRGEDVFVLMPTGGGKSLCYQLPSVVTGGLTIVVCPLVALMADQVKHLRDAGVRAAFLAANQPDPGYASHGDILRDLEPRPDPKNHLFNQSTNVQYAAAIKRGLETGVWETEPDTGRRKRTQTVAIQCLYVTPERLGWTDAKNGNKGQIWKTIRTLYQFGLLDRFVVDEAHCVTQWGHEFRRDYLGLSCLRKECPGVPIMALTATATTTVVADVVYSLSMAPVLPVDADKLGLNAALQKRGVPTASGLDGYAFAVAAASSSAASGAGAASSSSSAGGAAARLTVTPTDSPYPRFPVQAPRLTRIFRNSFNRKNLYYEIKMRQGVGDKQIIAIVDKWLKKMPPQEVSVTRKVGGGGRGALVSPDFGSRTVSRTTKKWGWSGIIYCLATKTCEVLAEKLNKEFGHGTAIFYHAQIGNDPGGDKTQRTENQRLWMDGEVPIVCATIAFGMGISKPDVRFVIHQSLPKSVTHYYQESGRAGRDGQPAECYMFWKWDDRSTLEGFLTQNQQGRRVEELERRRGLLALNELIQFCNNGMQCRRVITLSHFGEAFLRRNCNKMCDTCRDTRPAYLVDCTYEAALACAAVAAAERNTATRDSAGHGPTINQLAAAFYTTGGKGIREKDQTSAAIRALVSCEWTDHAFRSCDNDSVGRPFAHEKWRGRTGKPVRCSPEYAAVMAASHDQDVTLYRRASYEEATSTAKSSASATASDLYDRVLGSEPYGDAASSSSSFAASAAAIQPCNGQGTCGARAISKFLGRKPQAIDAHRLLQVLVIKGYLEERGFRNLDKNENFYLCLSNNGTCAAQKLMAAYEQGTLPMDPKDRVLVTFHADRPVSAADTDQQGGAAAAKGKKGKQGAASAPGGAGNKRKRASDGGGAAAIAGPPRRIPPEMAIALRTELEAALRKSWTTMNEGALKQSKPALPAFEIMFPPNLLDSLSRHAPQTRDEVVRMPGIDYNPPPVRPAPAASSSSAAAAAPAGDIGLHGRFVGLISVVIGKFCEARKITPVDPPAAPADHFADNSDAADLNQYAYNEDADGGEGAGAGAAGSKPSKAKKQRTASGAAAAGPSAAAADVAGRSNQQPSAGQPPRIATMPKPQPKPVGPAAASAVYTAASSSTSVLNTRSLLAAAQPGGQALPAPAAAPAFGSSSTSAVGHVRYPSGVVGGGFGTSAQSLAQQSSVTPPTGAGVPLHGAASSASSALASDAGASSASSLSRSLPPGIRARPAPGGQNASSAVGMNPRAAMLYTSAQTDSAGGSSSSAGGEDHHTHDHGPGGPAAGASATAYYTDHDDGSGQYGMPLAQLGQMQQLEGYEQTHEQQLQHEYQHDHDDGYTAGGIHYGTTDAGFDVQHQQQQVGEVLDVDDDDVDEEDKEEEAQEVDDDDAVDDEDGADGANLVSGDDVYDLDTNGHTEPPHGSSSASSHAASGLAAARSPAGGEPRSDRDDGYEGAAVGADGVIDIDFTP